MRIVAVLNQKGGVGKTTTAVNLGAALALRGRRVLLIDADPQGNLTDHLGLEPGDEDATLYDVLTEGLALTEATLETETDGLLVVPSEPDLAAAESELAGELGREGRLAQALQDLPADAYDWVLIDCPPSLGLLSINAMAAASELLITLQTEYFALKGLAALNNVIGMVRQHVNPDLALLGILPTLVNPVTLLSKEVIEEVRSHYGDVVFGTRIRQNVSLAEAPSRGAHIFSYRPGSRGAADYLRLADEIEGRRDARSRSHATRVATSKRKPQGLTRADAPSESAPEPAPEPVSEPVSEAARRPTPDEVAPENIGPCTAEAGPTTTEADPGPEQAGPAPEVTAVRAPSQDVDAAPEDTPSSEASSRTKSADLAQADRAQADRGSDADLDCETGYRTPPAASALATPVPTCAQGEAPMPPPEPLRTPALEPDTRGAPEAPTAEAQGSVDARTDVLSVRTPEMTTLEMPKPEAVGAPRSAMPAAVEQPAVVRETTVEVVERPVPTPETLHKALPEALPEAPVAEPTRSAVISEPAQSAGSKPGPVEMDADEARDWFRRAMARRENG